MNHKNAIILSLNEEVTEIVDLASSLDFKVIETFIQHRQTPDVNSYLGSGKIEEITDFIEAIDKNISLVIIDGELKPSQWFNLEKKIGIDVFDRVRLILTIFEERAERKEAKLQVKLAQLQYERPLVRELIHRAKSGEHPGFMAGGEYQVDDYYEMIKRQTKKIKRQLNQIRNQRNIRINSNIDKGGAKMKFRLSMIFVLCFHLIFCASSNKKAKEALMNDPAYHFSLGLSFMSSGDYNRAIKHFNDSLLLDPKYYYALSSRGIVNLMRGNLSESEKDLKECLRINPDFAEANNYLGVVYQEMGFLDMAENQFSKALRDKNYKSRELPYYNLARLYYVKRSFKEALDYVQKSIELQRDFQKKNYML